MSVADVEARNGSASPWSSQMSTEMVMESPLFTLVSKIHGDASVVISKSPAEFGIDLLRPVETCGFDPA